MMASNVPEIITLGIKKPFVFIFIYLSRLEIWIEVWTPSATTETRKYELKSTKFN